METSSFGLYSIEINGIRLYSTDPDELLRMAKEYELREYNSVVIRHPNREIMYSRRWEDV